MIDDRTVQCTVPLDPDGTASFPQDLYIGWPDYNSTAMSFELWDYPFSPRIDKLTSPYCYQSSDLSKPMQCLFVGTAQGVELTVHTSRLADPSQKWLCNLYNDNMLLAQWTSAKVDVSTGMLTCLGSASWFYYSKDVVSKFQVGIFGQERYYGSNEMSIELVEHIAYDIDTSSSDSKALTISLCVVFPLVFALVVMSVVYWRRQKIVSKSSDSIDLDASSDSMKHIELI